MIRRRSHVPCVLALAGLLALTAHVAQAQDAATGDTAVVKHQHKHASDAIPLAAANAGPVGSAAGSAGSAAGAAAGQDDAVNPGGLAQPGAGSLNAGNFKLALVDLVSDKKPVTLRGLADSFHIALPMPAAWHASQVSLTLRGVASRALLENSNLSVSVNGSTIGQFGLSGGDGSFTHRVDIAPALLHAGFNDVRIDVAHHSTRDCESSFAPELWTELDLAQSTFSADVAATKAPATLDHLADAFDKGTWQRNAAVTVMTFGGPDEPRLAALGLVAEGIGQRFDFLPVSISQVRVAASWAQIEAALPASQRSGVVLGTFDQFGSLLRDANIPTDQGAVLAMRPLASDPARVLVVIAAPTAAELVDAATVFALPQLPLPRHGWVAASQIVLPSMKDFDSRISSTTADQGAFPLRALGFRSATLTGMNSPGVSLRVWGGSWQGRMQLRFHLSYPSGMATQSALNVLVNGVLQSSIPLSDPAGGGYENYAVSVPSGAVRPGWNNVQFVPVLIPVSNGGECRPFFPGNLGLTIYQDTTLQKFSGSTLRRPDLALFAGNGSPYTDVPFGDNLGLALTDNSETTVGAGMTVLAKVAQVFHGPLIKASFGVGGNPKKPDLIWIGPYPSIPEAVRQRLSSSPPAQLIADVPLIESQSIPSPKLQWITRLRAWAGLDQPSDREVARVKVRLSGGFNDAGLALNAVDSNGVVTAFTAQKPASLQQAMAHLVDYRTWSQLSGSLTVWSTDGDLVDSISAEDAPFSGFGVRGGLSIWFSQNPWLSLLLITLLIAAMIYLTAAVLRIYRRRNP